MWRKRIERAAEEAGFWVRLLVVALVLLIAVKFVGGGSDPATDDYFQWFKDARYPSSYWQ